MTVGNVTEERGWEKENGRKKEKAQQVDMDKFLGGFKQVINGERMIEGVLHSPVGGPWT